MGAAQASGGCDELSMRLLEAMKQSNSSSTGSIQELLQRCGFQDERTRRRENLDKTLNEGIEMLFKLQDLNENGVLEESELIQLNKKVAMLHYGKDIDKEEVRAKYQELFRSKLDSAGEPVPLEKFRQHILDVLRAVDEDKIAQQMILEQWIAEAALGRNSFAIPSMHSISDLPFLLLKSFDVDPLSAAVLRDDRAVQTPPVAPSSQVQSRWPSEEGFLEPLPVLPGSILPDASAASPRKQPWMLPVPRAPAPSEATSSGISTLAAGGASYCGPAVQVTVRGAEVKVTLCGGGLSAM